MNAAIVLHNLTAYSLQLLLIVAVGGVLPPIFRLRSPRARLIYWQALLVCCLALPAVEPWNGAVDGRGGQVTVVTSGMPLAPGARTAQPLPLALWTLWLLAAGCVLRAGRLGVGLLRLRRYRTRAARLDAVPPTIREMSLRLGVSPALYISEDVQGPVTFGAISPVVILPTWFLSMREDARRSIVSHEFLHVRRRDWLFTVAEEFIRCALWFHPAVWWMLGRIQLSREQVVDHAAVLCVTDRARYLETLLDAAAIRSGLDPILAPLFLRKRHLPERVASLLKETSMSKSRLVSSSLPIAAFALFAMRISIVLFPLIAPAQETVSGPGVSADLGPYKLVHGSPAVYPEAARGRKIEGAVQLDANVDEQGAVTDARVLGGPPELRKAALEAVLTWHFAAGNPLPPMIPVTIRFQLSAGEGAPSTIPLLNGAPLAVKQILFGAMPGTLQETLTREMPVHAGDLLTQEALNGLRSYLSGVDEHLIVGVRAQAGGAILMISLPGASSRSSAAAASLSGPGFLPNAQRLRIDATVQENHLIREVVPAYPPLAKQARIQGTVRFTVLIGKDGSVEKIQLISGHPLLVSAAEAALRQWVYRPTLLNGQPVEVISQAYINFALPATE